MDNKVTLASVTGANNIANINDNFAKLERVVNDTMLSRKVSAGQPNQLLTSIDMNGQRMYNLPDPQSSGEPITFRYVESVQASVDGLEDLVVQSQGQLTAAQLANQQAQGILVDTRVIQVDVIAKANQVTVQAAQVDAQTVQVNTLAGQVVANAAAAQNSATNSANSATAADGSVTAAATQATNAQNSATAANTAKTGAETALASAVTARDAASASATAANTSATNAANSATDAANSAASINQPYLLNRANHTGTQAISTIVNLQSSLDAKKNITDNTTIAQGGTGATTAAGARTNLGLGSAAVAAILGTVSQSGGVPTGAILQRGSNANGEFIRHADGLLICTHKAPLASQTIAAGGITTGYDWTFPSAFVAVPTMSYSASGTVSYAFTIAAEGLSATQAPQIFARNSATASLTTALTLHLIAIGRWF